MAKKFWRPEIGIFLGLWLLGLAADGAFLKDPGTFWHTVVGNRILDRGQLPATDPFSFSYADQPWMSSQFWLAQITMAFLHRLGGWDTVVLATVTTIAALYTWVAYRVIRTGLHWLVATLVVILLVLASAYYFHPRPHLATMVLLAWTFARLLDFEAGRVSVAGLFWLVPIFILWSNLHGGMLGGLGTVGLAVAGWCGAWLIGWNSPVRSWRQVLLLIGLVGLLALTSLVHPAGWQLPKTWLSLMGSPVLPRYIDEHFPLDPRDRAGQYVLLFALVYLVGLASIWPRRPRVTWLLPMVWLFLALTRIRHGPLFALTAALALADLLPHTRIVDWLVRHRSGLFAVAQDADSETSRDQAIPVRPWRITHCVIPTAVVGLALLLQAGGFHVPLIGKGWAKVPEPTWPLPLRPQLEAYERDHPGAPILNDLAFGGFVIYYTPNLKVFIDDRCELYSDEFLQAYFEAKPDDIARWIKDHDIRIALVLRGGAIDSYLETIPGWVCAGETPRARLYLLNPTPAPK